MSAVRVWTFRLPEGMFRRKFMHYARFLPTLHTSHPSGELYYDFPAVSRFEYFLSMNLRPVEKPIRVHVLSEGGFAKLVDLIQTCPDLRVSVNCVISKAGVASGPFAKKSIGARWPGSLELKEKPVRFHEIWISFRNSKGDGTEHKLLHPKKRPGLYNKYWPLASVIWDSYA
jgi:hypothetical protein